MFSMKFKKIPSGLEKMKIKKSKRMNPYCSSAIIFSVLIGKNVKRIFDPSSGGNGIKLKKARSTFQKITIKSKAKKMEPTEPETDAEICSQEVVAIPKIIAVFTAVEIGMILAIIAAKIAIRMFEPGPPRATKAGPHFWFLRL